MLAPPPSPPTDAELLALEAGVVACLHDVARHELALREGRVTVRRLWRLLYSVSDLAAVLLLLSAAVRARSRG